MSGSESLAHFRKGGGEHLVRRSSKSEDGSERGIYGIRLLGVYMTEDQLKHVSGGYQEFPLIFNEHGVEDFKNYLHCTIVNDIHIQIISL